jgi:hypothetical protein
MKTRGVVTKETLILILAVLFVIAILFGGIGGSHFHMGYLGWSPAGLLFAALILVLILG